MKYARSSVSHWSRRVEPAPEGSLLDQFSFFLLIRTDQTRSPFILDLLIGWAFNR